MTLRTAFAKRLALALLGLGTIAGAASAANTYNPTHILWVLKYPHSALAVGNVVTIAHRGLPGPGCPENSACAIYNAYSDNVEAIELDVKESKDGTPWLFHDQNAGRLLHRPGNDFDIYSGRGWNPDFRTMTDAEIGNTMMKDHDFKVTNYSPLTVSRALDVVRTNANHMVIVFDIKTVSAVSAIADMVNQRGMKDQVVLKFSASLFARNPADIIDKTKGVHFAPTMYTGDMDNIINSGFGTSAAPVKCLGPKIYQCRIQLWADEAFKVHNYAWLEIGNKEPTASDPTTFLLNYMKSQKRAIGAYNPVPEYRANAGDGAYYIRSNGECCAKLSDYLSKSNYFGNETIDDRWQVGNQLNAGFTSVISDSPSAVNSAATHLGRRNTQLYQ
nr:glycerophosphodiester phosphodiesterase family protein [uncultured Duganella sp.]